MQHDDQSTWNTQAGELPMLETFGDEIFGSDLPEDILMDIA